MTKFEAYMLGCFTVTVIWPIAYTTICKGIDRFKARKAKTPDPNPLMADPMYRALSEGKQPRDKSGRFIKMTKRDRVHEMLRAANPEKVRG